MIEGISHLDQVANSSLNLEKSREGSFMAANGTFFDDEGAFAALGAVVTWTAICGPPTVSAVFGGLRAPPLSLVHLEPCPLDRSPRVATANYPQPRRTFGRTLLPCGRCLLARRTPVTPHSRRLDGESPVCTGLPFGWDLVITPDYSRSRSRIIRSQGWLCWVAEGIRWIPRVRS
jgi:hypothetical protein